MKKIIRFVVMALALGLAFTSCASKNSKKVDVAGPSVYKIYLDEVAPVITVGESKKVLKVSDQLPVGKTPVAGDKVRVIWTAISDEDIGNIYISCVDNADGLKELNLSDSPVTLVEGVTAGNAFYSNVTITLDDDVEGELYVCLWSDTEATCEVSYIDAK